MTVKLSAQGLSLFEVAGVPVQTFAAADSTPSVGNGRSFDTAGSTTIVRFDDSTQGQTIAIRATGPITIGNTANILLAGATDFSMLTGDVLLLFRFDATNVFVEVSRKASSVAADSLQTTGANVDVAAAAPPTVGQVLKATSATTAAWQAEAGGGAADALSTSGADVDVSAATPPAIGQALVATSPTTATWQGVAETVGGLEFLDIIEVTVDGQDFDFGAGGDGVFQRALDGDVDEAYVIEVFIAAPAAAVQLELQPNALATNQVGAFNFEGSSTGAGTMTTLRFANISSGREIGGQIEFQAKSGKPRAFQASMLDTDGTTVNVWRYDWAGLWTDTVVNVTSLRIHGNIAAAIKIGSRFVLWRKTSKNIRADSASTYERHVESTVAQGTNAEVDSTTGHATFQGSAIGVSVSLQDTVTSGSIIVNLKVATVTVMTVTLDVANPSFARSLESIGVHAIASGEEIEVGIATSSLVTTGAGTPAITVNVTLVNDALLAPAASFLGTANTFTKAQSVAPSALTWGANVAVDASLSNVFDLTLTGVTAQLDNPSNLTDGQTIVVRVTQDGTGGRALTFGTNWDFGADGAPVLTGEAANALSLIRGVSNGTKIFVSSKLGFVA